MYVYVLNVKEIDAKKEAQYAYPCYNYGDGTCSDLNSFHLKY